MSSVGIETRDSRARTDLQQVLCPCCRGESDVVDEYRRERIVGELTALLGYGIDDCDLLDYTLRKCRACSLEFADPMAEPPAGFYTWLTSTNAYFPGDRWEWTKCREQLAADSARSTASSPFTVLDVGCGDGGFLAVLAEIRGIRAIGLDVNPSAVDACRRRGLEAVCGTFAQFRERFSEPVQAITFWHVVEHVADPVGLLKDAAALLAQDGAIYFSVPLSPQSFEGSWHDPLNAPPHHLTRWNIPALRALATAIDMQMELVLPAADSFALRMLRTLNLQATSPLRRVGRGRKALNLAKLLARRPWLLALEAHRQMKRPRIDRKVRPDLVMVRLSNTSDRRCAA
jgi:SAM-dependent methyltransferase